MATDMKKAAGSRGSQRLTRDEWLARALHALAKEGGSILTLDALVRRLGVSRGSFYWHFKDRADFVRQLVKYWSVLFTESISEKIQGLERGPEQRLLSLMEAIVCDRLTRYDIAIRAWASHDVVAKRGVKEVDQFRLDFVRSLFREIGFEGEELEMRTRTFVVYYSLEPGLFSTISREQQLSQIKLRHRLLTTPE